MNKQHYSLLLLLFSLLFGGSNLWGQGTGVPSGGLLAPHPKQYFIKLCPGVSEMSVNTMLAELNSVELWKNDEIGLRIWAVKSFPYVCPDNGDEVSDIVEHIRRAREKSDINDAELDKAYEIPPGQLNRYVNEFDNLNIYAAQGPNPITISILDSGISDLSGANTGGYNFALTTYTGYDYIDGDDDPDDQHGHGTHIAGLIHHIVNQQAGPSNISFDIRKTHDENGFGHISNIVTATVDAVQAGADIINMSFSYYGLPVDTAINPLELAIEYARQNGVLVVASAGNSGLNNDLGPLAPLPASLLLDNILAVQSNSGQNQLSSFSNFGGQSVDVSILGEFIPGPDLSGDVTYSSGTSFSTAIVTALSAILGTHENNFNYCETKCVLISSSVYSSTMAGLNQAEGIIDFQNALNDLPAGCNPGCSGFNPVVEVDCGLNCPPETNDMNICVDEGQTVTASLLVYDQESDDMAFEPSPVYGPFNGTAIINPDGSFSYTSNNGETDMFVYRVCDGVGASGVLAPPSGSGNSQTIISKVSSGNDDVEELIANGAMYSTSTDLEMIDDSDWRGKQVIGIRFNNLDIPQGATIENAVIRFIARESNSVSTSLLFKGHNTDNAAGFTTAAYNVSSRPTTSASTSWNNIPGWTAGTTYASPDLSGIIQEIVNRGGWAPGNSLAIIVTGTGKRSARTYDSHASLAPELEITFSGSSSSGSQTCSDGCNQGVVYINGMDCRIPKPPYLANGGAPQTISRRVSASNDDAEEDVGSSPGPVSLNSADLEMVYDPGWANADQAVGMRFTDITIPPGATIQSATIMFTSINSKSEATSLLFQGHDTDNAPAFSNAYYNISSRPKTAASASWNNVPAWTAGNSYFSPDLSGIIQEIVGRPGWSSGNSLAITVTGSGKRDAYAYDGSTLGAPLLDITFSGGSPAPPSVECCAQTGSKPQVLVLKYTGAGCSATSHNMDPNKVSCSGDPQNAPFVYVTATDGGSKVYLAGKQVALGESFDVNALSIVGESRLKNDLTIYLKDAQGNTLQTVKFHTSCSQPLSTGDRFGALSVQGFLAENGELCGVAPISSGFECCARTGANPQVLVLKYTGADCSATSHYQDPNKVSCSGDPQNAPFVYVTVTDGGSKVYLAGQQVALNERFDVNALTVGDNKLKNDLTIYLKDAQGNTLQTVEFHTSCSQPLSTGNQFGALRLEGYLAENGELCGAVPISSSANCCAATGASPKVLNLKYTGADCSATSHYQDPDKVDCSGDPQNAPFVYVTVTDGGSKVYLSGRQVALDENFDVDAMNIGDNKLKNDLTVYLKDAEGNILQTVEFHTSCSQPLTIGDQFGALLVEGFLAENDNLSGEPPISQICAPELSCGRDDKRSVIGFMYTGNNVTNVYGYTKSGQQDHVGAFTQVEPGDFIAFSSAFRNKDRLDKLFLVKEGEAAEIEVPTDCGVNILGKIYGDFVVVYQVDKVGEVCSVPYSSCIEVNVHCGYPEYAPARVAGIPDHFVPLTPEQETRGFSAGDKDVQLYPNPATGAIYLNLKDFAGQPVDIAIYDSVSRLVKRTRVDEAGGAPFEMKLETLDNGMYIVAVHPEGEQPVLKKLVIAK